MCVPIYGFLFGLFVRVYVSLPGSPINELYGMLQAIYAPLLLRFVKFLVDMFVCVCVCVWSHGVLFDLFVCVCVCVCVCVYFCRCPATHQRAVWRAAGRTYAPPASVCIINVLLDICLLNQLKFSYTDRLFLVSARTWLTCAHFLCSNFSFLPLLHSNDKFSKTFDSKLQTLLSELEKGLGNVVRRDASKGGVTSPLDEVRYWQDAAAGTSKMAERCGCG